MAKWTLSAAAALLIAAIASTGRPTAAEPGDELPDGAGKDILRRSCRSCHDLREVTKFSGYWERTQWHDAIVTMVAYGAKVNEGEVEVLADYLAQHLGRRN